MLIFVSAEDIDDPLALSLSDALVADGWQIDRSPRNPRRGEDKRWEDWYQRGCPEALAHADAFVAIATSGWSGSTWIASEADTALTQGLLPFLWNPNHVPVPPGLRQYAEQPLGASVSAAVRQLADHRAAAPSSLDRHLRRLFRFLTRLPGRPEWSNVMIGQSVPPTGPFDELSAPTGYAPIACDGPS